MRLLDLLPLARLSLSDPRTAYGRLRSLRLDRAELWQALAAVVAVSVVLTELTLRALLSGAGEPTRLLVLSPLATAAVQAAAMLLLAAGVFWGGRIRGGQGSFDDALLAVIWLQVLLIGVQALQALALLVFPPLVDALGIAGIVLFFWLLTGFTAELHGFRSRPAVLAGIFVGMFLASLAATLLLVMLGIDLTAGLENGNV